MFPWDSSNNLANFMLQQSEEIHQNNMNRIRQDMNESTHRTNLAIAQREANEAAFRAQNMESDLGFYRNLLTRPMEEIAAYSLEFAKTYRKQQFILSSWVLSQKALRDLAYDLGFTLGFTEQKVDAIFLERVDEIASGTNPNDAMPTSLDEYTNVSKHIIRRDMAEKYNGKLPVLQDGSPDVSFENFESHLETNKPRKPTGSPKPPKTPKA